MNKQLETPLLLPLQVLTFAVLLLSFAYILDDLLAWLGWRFLQNGFSDGIALVLAVVLGVAAFVWRSFVPRLSLDDVDFGGLLVGCVFAGLVLACYTVHPVAGFITIVVFALLAYGIFRARASLTHAMIVTSMTVAFGAGTVLVSNWLYPGQSLHETQPAPAQVFHVVAEQAGPDEGSYSIYACNAVGMFCEAASAPLTAGADEPQLLLEPGAVLLLIDGQPIWQMER